MLALCRYSIKSSALMSEPMFCDVSRWQATVWCSCSSISVRPANGQPGRSQPFSAAAEYTAAACDGPDSARSSLASRPPNTSTLAPVASCISSPHATGGAARTIRLSIASCRRVRGADRERRVQQSRAIGKLPKQHRRAEGAVTSTQRLQSARFSTAAAPVTVPVTAVGRPTVRQPQNGRRPPRAAARPAPRCRPAQHPSVRLALVRQFAGELTWRAHS